jgi:hypothetical protein
MTEIKVYKTSEKVIIWLHRENKSQQWLSEQLGQTRQAMSQKIRDNMFTPGDIIRLQLMGCPL